jgi:hypothetical protein
MFSTYVTLPHNYGYLYLLKEMGMCMEDDGNENIFDMDHGNLLTSDNGLDCIYY